MWNINGTIINNEQELRDYCFNYTKKGFKQDFRLASQAYKLPPIQLIELLTHLGHQVEEL